MLAEPVHQHTHDGRGDMRYRGEIDGLRAIAVIPVILFHAGMESVRSGFVGVDVFFVISGYLITSILIDEKRKGQLTLAGFYERRARRILPALYLVMLASVPFALAWMSPADLKSYSQSLAAVPLYLSNVLFWKTSGYFDVASELKPFLHTWSLAVEEQYYLLYPACLLLLWKKGIALTHARVLMVAGLCLAGALAIGTIDENAAFYLLPARAWELLIGVHAACLLDARDREPASTAKSLAALTGLAAILITMSGHLSGMLSNQGQVIIAVSGTWLLIVHADETNRVGRLLNLRPLVGIGLISYSAYLWHQPLFALARHYALGEPAWQVMLLLSMAALVLAWLSWRYVEAPYRSRDRFTRRQILLHASTATLALCLMGMAGHVTNGFLQQVTTPEQRRAIATATSSPERTRCHQSKARQVLPADACIYGTAPPSWAVIGDSHAVELAYALAQRLAREGHGLQHFSFSNCVPAYGRPKSASQVPCNEWTERAVEYVANDRGIKTVVISYRFAAVLEGEHEGTYPELPHDVPPPEQALRTASLHSMIRALQAADKRVILALQAPEIPFGIQSLIVRTDSPTATIPGVSRDWWEARTASTRAWLPSLPEGVIVADPTPLFCNEVQCDSARNGTAFYFDDDHPSVPGALLIADAIIDIAGSTTSNATRPSAGLPAR